jgi:hypothetical protein
MSIITDINIARRGSQMDGAKITSFHFPVEQMSEVVAELHDHLAPMFILSKEAGPVQPHEIERAIRMGTMRLMGIRIECYATERLGLKMKFKPGQYQQRPTQTVDEWAEMMRKRNHM